MGTRSTVVLVWPRTSAERKRVLVVKQVSPPSSTEYGSPKRRTTGDDEEEGHEIA